MVDSPPISALCGALQRSHREPENRPASRVLVRNNFAVVVPHRLPRPANALGFFRQIYIYERKCLQPQQQMEYPDDIRFERREFRFAIVAHVCAERDAAGAEQGGLLRCCKSARMPAGVAQVKPEVDSRKNDVNLSPAMHAECHRSGGCAFANRCAASGTTQVVFEEGGARQRVR